MCTYVQDQHICVALAPCHLELGAPYFCSLGHLLVRLDLKAAQTLLHDMAAAKNKLYNKVFRSYSY